MRNPLRHNPFPWRLAGALLATSVALAGVRDISEGSGAVGEEKACWKIGVAAPIDVEAGLARFTVPSTRPSSRTLVIVSSLARSSREYPIRLSARPATNSEKQSTPRSLDTRTRPRPALDTNLPSIPEPVATTPPSRRSFHLMARAGDVASASNYLAVESVLKGYGKRVQVYVDANDDGQVDPETVDAVVSVFDDKVFPVAAKLFGQAKDVDADGRFTVLLSSWLTRMGGGRNPVDGFVRGADLDLGLPAPFSNHCDMMYLSASLKAGPHLRTVVAHDYTHAVTFSAKAFDAADGGYHGQEEEGWIDEALAHLVEDLHGFSRTNIDYRVSGFLSRPESYRLVVDDYYAADLFRSHGNRGGTYLFLRWCADRFGPALITDLIRSDKRGVANLEAATGRSFESLYREWTVALYMDGLAANSGSELGVGNLDVTRRVDDAQLAGPRAHRVRLNEPSHCWSSAGTAARYLLVDGSSTGGVEVTVEGPPSARLQVTAVPLPDDMPLLELEVKAEQGGRGQHALLATLRERGGAPVRLKAMSWEPAVPAADPHAPGFRHAILDETPLALAFDGLSIPTSGMVVSRPISPAGALPRITPLVVRVIGIDSKGRRVVAWADLMSNADDEDGDDDKSNSRDDEG